MTSGAKMSFVLLTVFGLSVSLSVSSQAMTCNDWLSSSDIVAEITSANVPKSRSDQFARQASEITALLQRYPSKLALKILQTLMLPKFDYYSNPEGKSVAPEGHEKWNLELPAVIEVLKYARDGASVDDVEAYFDDVVNVYKHMEPADLATSIGMVRLIETSFKVKIKPTEIFNVAKSMSSLTYKPAPGEEHNSLARKSSVRVIEQALLSGQNLGDIENKIESYKKLVPAEGKAAFEHYFEK